jgi:hypothetical protein
MEGLELSAMTVTFVVSFFIPVLTGLLTKVSTSSGVKGLLTLVLNAVNALVVGNMVADGSVALSKETLVTFFLGLAISIASYSGVYKPLNITSSTLDGKLAPNKGLL